MATYLVDYENVHQHGLSGIEKLSDSDTVIVFVGNATKNVPIETVLAMLHSPAQVKIKKVKKTADNYLDFQLGTCLGGLVAGGNDKEFCIVSKDRDYEPVIDYWKQNKPNVKIEQRAAISKTAPPPGKTIPATATSPSKKLDDATKKTIRDLVKDEKLSSGNYTGIYNLFLNEHEKQVFHTGLIQLFEQKQGSRLYKLLKDTFDQYNSQKHREMP